MEFKCPNCSAPLRFDPSAQEVVCDNCNTTISVEGLKASVDGGFDWGDLKRSFANGETFSNTKVYQCQSCSAIIEADENTAATTCPYCDNNVVLTDRVSGGLKPNAIIPFKIDKKDVKGLIDRFYKGKKLLPKDFFEQNTQEKIHGVYVPFWLFNANVDGRVTMNASITRVHRMGDYKVTDTDHFLLERGGDMDFKNLPVDASTKFDDDLMDSIEPFDYSQLKDFDPGYLTGFVADRFDSDPDSELPRAERRMVNSAVRTLSQNPGPYMISSVASTNMNVRRADVKYVFLPVYLLNCQYQGKKYRYAVNGQTGKVVGELPSSKSKAFKYFMVPFAIALAVVTALVMIM